MSLRIFVVESPNNLLEIICEKMLERAQKDFSNFILLFPHKRPKFYIRKILYKKVKDSFISPLSYSLDEFIEEILSEEIYFKNLNLIDGSYILWNIVKELGILNNISDSFDRFFPWGIRFIKALEELEMNKVSFNRAELFSEYTDVIEDVRSFLKNMTRIRERFYYRIKENNTFTRSLKFKEALGIIERKKNKNLKFISAGFYVFLPLEEDLIRKLWENYDFEIYFLETYKQKGLDEFYKKYKDEASEFKIIKSNKNKKLYLFNLKFVQVKNYIAEFNFIKNILLMDKKEKYDPLDTGIILPDPSVVENFVGEIFSFLKTEFNLSMGFSFKITPYFSFIRSFFELKSEEKKGAFYYKSLLKFLKEPLIKNLYPKEASLCELKIYEMNRDSGIIFFRPEELISDSFNKKFIKTIHLLKRSISSIYDAICVIEEMFSNLEEEIQKRGSVIFKVFLREIFRLFDKLREGEVIYVNLNKESVFKILMSFLSEITVPLSGHPLKGIQIQGVLEARLLPFKRIFFCDLNEGIYPKSYKYDPILPDSLRKILNIPSYRDNESIFEYYFYQLIQNAEEVYLIWREKSEEEVHLPSRFVQKVIWEREKREKTFIDDRITKVSYNLVFSKEKEKRVKKDEKIMKKLNSIVFNPTILDEYILCPFRFYQIVIIGNKKEEFIEEPEGKVLGSFLHKFLKYFYERYFFNNIPEWNPDMINRFKSELSEMFDREFSVGKRDILWLRKEWIILKMEHFLNKRRGKEGRIIGLEKSFEREIVLNDIKIKAKGIVDRMEESERGIFIVDYKTSKSNFKKPKFPSSFERKAIKNDMRSLQLPFYSLLIGREDIIGGVYMFFNGEDPLFFLFEGKFSVKGLREIIYCILKEIFDPSVDFVPDPENNPRCQFCAYKEICGAGQ